MSNIVPERIRGALPVVTGHYGISSRMRFPDPLVYLVPLALAFPPLLAYGGRVLGWPGGWLSTRVALVICIGLFLLFRLLRRDFSYRRIPGMRFVAPYLLLVVVSVLWSILGPYNDEAGAIGNELVSWMIPVAIFLFIGASPHEESEFRSATRVLVGVAVVVALYSALQALALTGNERLVPRPIADLTRYGQDDLWFGSFRVYGTFPNLGPNFLGGFLLFPTVLAFSRTFAQRGLAMVLWLCAALAGAATIVGTYSRGAMLGLAVALIVLPFWRRSVRGAAGMAGAIAVMALAVAQTPIGRHVGSLYTAGQFDVSASARVDTWGAVFQSAAQHPFGLGFNGWLRASRTSAEVGLLDPPASIGSEHPAENQWMRELADRGIPGVLALGLLMGGIVLLTFRAANPRRSSGYARDFLAAAGAASVGWALAFLTGDHLMYENVAGIFWYAIALALAATRAAMPPLAGDVESSRFEATLVARDI